MPTPAATDEYAAAIQAARNGDAANAIEILQRWHKLQPHDQHAVDDLAAVLSASGRHAEALEFFDSIAHPERPAYAIKAVASSARAAGFLAKAEAAYRILLGKTPDDGEVHAGLAYVWQAQGKTDQAIEYLRQALKRNVAMRSVRDAPMLVALAELHEQRGEWLRAAAAWQDVLRLQPGSRYAVRGRVFALRRVGAFHLAQRLAESDSVMFDKEELLQFAHDAAARDVTFGEVRLAVDQSPQRHEATDFALARNAAVLQRKAGKDTLSDRLVALRDRMRMREAVVLYESLLADGLRLAPYARIAAADAYLHLGQPEKARDLYLGVLHDEDAASGGDTDWKVALIYAYGEAEDHDAAQALADRFLNETPAVIHKGVAALEAPNPDYARFALMTALVRLYADRLDEAQLRLAELRAIAPYNAGVRAAWASLQSARERPRAALEEFTLLRVDEPASFDAATGQADSLLALNRVDEAREEIRSLQVRQPENKAVQNLVRRLDSHERLYLKIDTTLGRGASVAGADTVMEASLHSAPLTGSLGTAFRVVGRSAYSAGDSGGVPVSRTQAGAGLEYNGGDWRAEAALKETGAAGGGMVLALAHGLSDSWNVSASFDSNVNALPLAAIRNRLHARSLSIAGSWTASESRHATMGASGVKFSDGNRRMAFEVSWSERWVSGPSFKLESTLALSASDNSLVGASYFNPDHDTEAALSITAEWLAWRRYERSFRHRLSASAGRYWQDGFGADSSSDLRYENEWRSDPNLALRYGIGHSFHPYDGKREHRNYGFLNLFWRMK